MAKKRNVTVFFEDILDSILKIQEYTLNLSEEEFEKKF
jgi:uncharacterized protein with HEPN domain